MRNYIWRALAAGLALLIPMTIVPSASAFTNGPRYASIIVGRDQLGEGDGNCKLSPNAVSTMYVVQYLASKGMKAGGNVIITRTNNDNTNYCIGGRHLYLNWAQIRTLHNQYGYEPQTSGYNYVPLVGKPYDVQKAEVCGAKNALKNRGYSRFYGMYAAPAPANSPALDDQSLSVVESCGFIKGRDYGQHTYPYMPVRSDGTRIRTNKLSNLNPEGYYRTLSFNGGSCPSWAPCSDGQNYTYMTSDEILKDLKDAPAGSHWIGQAYRYVIGDTDRWKCSGPEETHWTYAVETRCWVDDKKVFDWLAASDYIVTDPQTVIEKLS